MQDLFNVHMISLRNKKEHNSFSTLFDDQEPQPWQLDLLQDYINMWKKKQNNRNSFI